MESLPILICILGPMVLIVFLISRKSGSPKDVFFTSKSEPIKGLEKIEITKYQELKNYKLYLWFYQHKDKNSVTRCVALYYQKSAQLANRFPKIFEYIFLLMCVPQRLGKDWENRFKNMNQNQRNREIIETNIVHSLMFIPFVIIVGLSISPFQILCVVVILILLTGNIATCFKKLNQNLSD